ncbi:hypothetical protein IFM89_021908 [Coptis chinensis]|uniref:Transmembrane protein n=1 Tax=Coptis chinensis TaxID=261450 RepID=A0A835HJ45_9MAGN|nr:hypothetical protein IFM89_021908 [Coptis chinensis]
MKQQMKIPMKQQMKIPMKNEAISRVDEDSDEAADAKIMEAKIFILPTPISSFPFKFYLLYVLPSSRFWLLLVFFLGIPVASSMPVF